MPKQQLINKLGWASACLLTAILGMVLVRDHFIEFSMVGYVFLTAGFVEAWDTISDAVRFKDFDTAAELRRGNMAVAVYYLGRVALVLGACFIAEASA